MSMKWGLSGRGPVAIVTDGVNNSAKQFLSVSVITGGTNKNASNNVKKFPFLKVSYLLRQCASLEYRRNIRALLLFSILSTFVLQGEEGLVRPMSLI